MDGLGAGKLGWVSALPAGPSQKVVLNLIVDADSGGDVAENSYYEAAADPGFVWIETAQRHCRGQYLRRLRRLAERARSRRVWSRRISGYASVACSAR